MKALNKDFKTKRERLRNNASLTEAQKKEQIKALAQERRTELKTILTTGQQQKLEAIPKEHCNKQGK